MNNVIPDNIKKYDKTDEVNEIKNRIHSKAKVFLQYSKYASKDDELVLNTMLDKHES